MPQFSHLLNGNIYFEELSCGLNKINMCERAWNNSFHKTSTQYVLIMTDILLNALLGALTDTGSSK